MKSIKFFFLYAFSTLIYAQDHLYPLERLYENEAFKQASTMYVDFKVIIDPSFTSASTLYVTEFENVSTLAYLKLSSMLQHPSEAKEMCKITINNHLAKRLEGIWKSELYKTRYPKKLQEVRDGTTYLFALPSRVYHTDKGWDSQPKMQGYAWSPPHKSRMGKFVTLVDSLKEYCLTQKNLVALNAAMDSLVVK